MKIKLNQKGSRQFAYRHVFVLYTLKWEIKVESFVFFSDYS